MATLLNSKMLFGRPFLRLFFYMPYVIPAISGVFIWQSFLNGDTGWLDRLLKSIGSDHRRDAVDEANRAGLAGAEAISAGADLESAETRAIAAAGDRKPPLRGLALFWAASSRPPESRPARLAYGVIRLLAILVVVAEILRIAFRIFGGSFEA